MTHEMRLQSDQALIEDYLRACLADQTPHVDLLDAMKYSLLGGGKRIRPVLTIEACRLCGGKAEDALPFAAAVEMIHTYSLIHDDLPCMDDDDLRRGQPSSHKVFGEATAVLAGDALLTEAFGIMAARSAHLPAERVVCAVARLARAAGAAGMVGGQALDMAGEGHALFADDVKQVLALKTGALIEAAVDLGCIAAGAGDRERALLREYGANLAFAFQLQDDILDVEGDRQELGKPVGSDAASEKTTLVALKGLEECRAMVDDLTAAAAQPIADWEKSDFLIWLVQTLAHRSK